MPEDIVLLTGAPPCSSLGWDEASLLTEFDPSISRFLNIRQFQPRANAGSQGVRPSPTGPEWRSIAIRTAADREQKSHDDAIHTGSSSGGHGFFSVAGAANVIPSPSPQTCSPGNADDRASQLVTQFYEHTFLSLQGNGSHGDVASSTPPDGSSVPLASGLTDDEGSSWMAPRSEIDHTPKPAFMDRLTPVRLTTISAVPAAAHLADQQGQAATRRVNLIAGIITIERPRAVRTRWGGTTVLVELLLGDDTQSGLSISFWHASLAAAEAMARKLRRRDVVMIQDLVLGVFMGKVYGRSIRGDVVGRGRRGTRVQVLYRDAGYGSDRDRDGRAAGGYYSGRDLAVAGGDHEQLARTRGVHEWVQRFIAAGATATDREDEKGANSEIPPAESQD